MEKMRYNLEPWEADHLYVRLRQIERAGVKACEQETCPASLSRTQIEPGNCSICCKLFPEAPVTKDASFFFSNNTVLFNHGFCPCNDPALRPLILSRVEAALYEHYSERGFTKEYNGPHNQD